jgi:hypothetical protein
VHTSNQQRVISPEFVVLHMLAVALAFLDLQSTARGRFRLSIKGLSWIAK